MSEQISDHDQSGARDARLREYTRQERRAGMHPAIAKLRSRPQARGEENRKIAEFLRIARGRTT